MFNLVQAQCLLSDLEVKITDLEIFTFKMLNFHINFFKTWMDLVDIWIVLLGDSLHEISKPVFWEK